MHDTHVIIMAGGLDIGRHPLASHLPPCLWPVGQKAAIEHLLDELTGQGAEQITICTPLNGGRLRQAVAAADCEPPGIYEEELPTGTAGCIERATRDADASLVVVLPANIMCPPSLEGVIEQHRSGNADMTVLLDPACDGCGSKEQTSDIYVLGSNVVELVPAVGFFDIKEGLIPRMIRQGMRIQAAVLAAPTGRFRHWREYLASTADYLEWTRRGECGEPESATAHCGTARIAADAAVAQSARILGSVEVCSGAEIAEDAVVIGPTVIGREAVVGQESIVVGSVLWAGAQIGRRAKVRNCVLDCGVCVPEDGVVDNRAVSTPRRGHTRKSAAPAARRENMTSEGK